MQQKQELFLKDLPPEIIAMIVTEIMESVAPHPGMKNLLCTSKWLRALAVEPTRKKAEAWKLRREIRDVASNSAARPQDERAKNFSDLAHRVMNSGRFHDVDLAWLIPEFISALRSLAARYRYGSFNLVIAILNNIGHAAFRADGIEHLSSCLAQLEEPRAGEESAQAHLARWKNAIDGFKKLIALATAVQGDAFKGRAGLALVAQLHHYDGTTENLERFLQLAGLFRGIELDDLKLQGVAALVQQFITVQADEDIGVGANRNARVAAFKGVLDIVKSIGDEALRAQGIEQLAPELKVLEDESTDDDDEPDEEYLASLDDAAAGYDSLIQIAAELTDGNAKARAGFALLAQYDKPVGGMENVERFVRLAGIFQDLTDDALKLQGVKALVAKRLTMEMDRENGSAEGGIDGNEAENNAKCASVSIFDIVKSIGDSNLKAQGLLDACALKLKSRAWSSASGRIESTFAAPSESPPGTPA